MRKTDGAADGTAYDSEVHCINKVTFLCRDKVRRGDILFF